ncbi:hypothetical protein [Oceanobacillus kapialis]|uniref:Uncharacterized protein n=1 Tax=Oceanobacillus kapialis TaxID=481353 RepID=A0ABW5PYR7_9BACI
MVKKFVYLICICLLMLGINQTSEVAHQLQQTSSADMVLAVKDVHQVQIAHITTPATLTNQDHLEKPFPLPPIIDEVMPKVEFLNAILSYPETVRIAWQVDTKKYHSNYLS